MTTIDAAALEKVLSSIDVSVVDAQRVTLNADGTAHLASGATWLVFIADSSLHGQPPLSPTCTLDDDRGSTDVAATPGTVREELIDGDAFLTPARQSTTP